MGFSHDVDSLNHEIQQSMHHLH